MTFQIVLAVWVIWHLAFGVLATFLPDTGARLGGWSPEAGWTSDMLALSTQYGMVMLLLALVYAIALIDPIRYLRVLWVAIAEQVLGIAYAVYIYTNIGSVTLAQVSIQALINIVFVVVFVMFWRNLQGHYSTSTR